MKVRIQTVAASAAQEAYQAFFKAKLEAYGVKSPAELSAGDKSKFFSEIKSEWAEEKSKAVAASPAQEAYQKFFKAKLEDYGVKSPAELTDEDKSKFFSEIKEEWASEKNKATASITPIRDPRDGSNETAAKIVKKMGYTTGINKWTVTDLMIDVSILLSDRKFVESFEEVIAFNIEANPDSRAFYSANLRKGKKALQKASEDLFSLGARLY